MWDILRHFPGNSSPVYNYLRYIYLQSALDSLGSLLNILHITWCHLNRTGGHFGLSSSHVGSCKWSRSVHVSTKPFPELLWLRAIKQRELPFEPCHGRGPLLQEMKDNLEAVGALCCHGAFSRWRGSPSRLVFILCELVLRMSVFTVPLLRAYPRCDWSFWRVCGRVVKCLLGLAAAGLPSSSLHGHFLFEPQTNLEESFKICTKNLKYYKKY